CKVMLTDGLNAAVQDGKKAEGEVEVVDVAQMLLAAVRRGNEGGERVEVSEPEPQPDPEPAPTA
ncbi:MAG: hypothetical protein HOP99_08415, partial [Dermatophilaceae bacterium]|nr:hypothetical protein [Dermatophilaceae bacterium]